MPSLKENLCRCLLKVLRPLVIIAAYLFMAWGIYVKWLGMPWTLVDVIYFSSATVTTVGFGDVVPTGDLGLVFTCFFLLFGVGVVAISMFTIIRWFHRRQDHWLKFLLMMNDKEGAVKEHKGTQFAKGVLLVLAKVAGGIAASGFVGGFEGWSLIESVYYGCATTTGVGYGDFAPETQKGRLYAAFLMPISITIMLNAMAEMNVLYQMMKLQRENKLQQIIEKLFKEARAKGAMGGNASEVTLAEFQLHMVKQMGKVEEALLDEIQQFFNAMDVDNNGVLTLEDIAILNTRNGSAMEQKFNGPKGGDELLQKQKSGGGPGKILV